MEAFYFCAIFSIPSKGQISSFGQGFYFVANKCFQFNSFLNDKIFHWSKLKAGADDNFNMAEIFLLFSDRVKNTVGKGENADYLHFLLFPQCFPKPSLLGLLKVGIVW